MAESASWDGAYIGAVGGFSLGSNFIAENFGPFQNTAGNWSGTPIGVTIGYNRQLGDHFVIGAEADYSFGDIVAMSIDSADFTCTDGFCETTVNNTATLRARAGYVTGNMMVFATAGYAFANGAVTAGNANFVHGSGPISGLVLGAGIEYALHNNWSVKAEYLATDYGRLDASNLCALNCYTDIQVQSLRIGINRSF